MCMYCNPPIYNCCALWEYVLGKKNRHNHRHEHTCCLFSSGVLSRMTDWLYKRTQLTQLVHLVSASLGDHVDMLASLFTQTGTQWLSLNPPTLPPSLFHPLASFQSLSILWLLPFCCHRPPSHLIPHHHHTLYSVNQSNSTLLGNTSTSLPVSHCRCCFCNSFNYELKITRPERQVAWQVCFNWLM